MRILEMFWRADKAQAYFFLAAWQTDLGSLEEAHPGICAPASLTSIIKNLVMSGSNSTNLEEEIGAVLDLEPITCWRLSDSNVPSS
jgi:hypothetical protein